MIFVTLSPPYTAKFDKERIPMKKSVRMWSSGSPSPGSRVQSYDQSGEQCARYRTAVKEFEPVC